ncbi:hypothetical protein J3B01_001732 [Coemansia erecta]|nr:hypothetical protein IWW35_004300 [Coemansia sp. RSA 1878]KAJ2837972.1 hypothetical protein J3B01_001732 [Coemansia erecta]
MDGAFARLYRTSKLASYDRSIKQIYTTTGIKAKAKDWGLKRPMPKNMKTRLASIDELDTREQFTEFTPANKEFMIMQTWKENFTESHSPNSEGSKDDAFDVLGGFDGQEDRFEDRVGDIEGQGSRTENERPKRQGPLRNLSRMTEKQWNKFLQEAYARRPEWKDELAKGNFVPEEALAFMGAINGGSSDNDGVHRQPTYHNYMPPTESMQVQGRVVNRLGSMYAVAVQGIMASLPLHNHTVEAGFHLRDVKTFYVHSAKFDTRGRPVVMLGLQPRGSRDSSVTFEKNQGRFSFSKSIGGGTTMHNEYLDRIKDSIRLGSFVGKNKNSNESANENSEPDAVKDTLDFLRKDRK